MHRTLQTFWSLAVVGGAIAVAILTHDAALITITFIGGLIFARALGLAGPSTEPRGC
jgi:hypothetical protein